MPDYFNTELSDNALHAVSAPGLAHVGDAVYELMVRVRLCTGGVLTAKKLHALAVSYVSASAQAAAMERILPVLSENELAVYKRGRNAHVTPPRGASPGDYHAATGLEALFGYLYLKGERDRLTELFEIAVSRE